MKKNIITALLFNFINAQQVGHYNILAMDGGGIRGLIPAMVIAELEKVAYKYKKEMGYNVPTYYDNGKELEVVHMRDLFDMTAGTSTGSILAAGLAYTNTSDNKPPFFAKELIDIYSTKGDIIFTAFRISPVLMTFLDILITLLVSYLGYAIGKAIYEREQEYKQLQRADRIRRKVEIAALKGQKAQPDDDDYENMKNPQEIEKNLIELEARNIQLDLKAVLLEKLEQEKLKTFQQMTPQERFTANLTLKKQQIKSIYDHFTKAHEEEGIEALDTYEKNLNKLMRDIERNRPKKWIFCAIFFIIGLILGLLVPKLLWKIFSSRYTRAPLDNIMKDYLGAKFVSQFYTNEALITAFDYNSLEPRFFSKYFAKLNPGIYNVSIGDSTGASSAAPTYFDPKITENAYFTELQVDGGIICNNPSLYAYQLAKLLNRKENIRILSIGTGEKQFIPFTSAKQMGKMSWIKRIDEFMMNMDVHAAEYYLKNIAYANNQ